MAPGGLPIEDRAQLRRVGQDLILVVQLRVGQCADRRGVGPKAFLARDVPFVPGWIDREGHRSPWYFEMQYRDAAKRAAEYTFGMPDLNHAIALSPEVEEGIDALFQYKEWDESQKLAGAQVRDILADAFKVLIVHVPPCADRTVALRKIREARMDANSAISSFGGF
jgi:hypothetical protein